METVGRLDARDAHCQMQSRITRNYLSSLHSIISSHVQYSHFNLRLGSRRTGSEQLFIRKPCSHEENSEFSPNSEMEFTGDNRERTNSIRHENETNRPALITYLLQSPLGPFSPVLLFRNSNSWFRGFHIHTKTGIAIADNADRKCSPIRTVKNLTSLLFFQIATQPRHPQLQLQSSIENAKCGRK